MPVHPTLSLLSHILKQNEFYIYVNYKSLDKNFKQTFARLCDLPWKTIRVSLAYSPAVLKMKKTLLSFSDSKTNISVPRER